MKIEKIIIVVILLGAANSRCSNEPKQYNYKTAYVYKSTPIHWGKGYFKLMVYYEFEYNGEKYKGKYKYNKLSRIYSKRFNKGDSVIIKFPATNVEKNTIIKLKYIKSKDYHIH